MKKNPWLEKCETNIDNQELRVIYKMEEFIS